MAARVLIAEDEPNIVESLRFLLERAGFEVMHVLDGEAALAQTRSNPPDVLVLDIMLPRLSGFDVLRTIRSEAPLQSLPVLMLTAKGQSKDRQSALDLGASAFITKPFNNSEIIAQIQRLAGQMTAPDPAEAPPARSADSHRRGDFIVVAFVLGFFLLSPLPLTLLAQLKVTLLGAPLLLLYLLALWLAAIALGYRLSRPAPSPEAPENQAGRPRQ